MKEALEQLEKLKEKFQMENLQNVYPTETENKIKIIEKAISLIKQAEKIQSISPFCTCEVSNGYFADIFSGVQKCNFCQKPIK